MGSISKKKIVGIDDAGRGSIIGPIVIGGVAVDQKGFEDISVMGIKDSKALSPEGRQKALLRIKGIVERISLRKIMPEEIDKFVSTGEKYKRLNYLEALKMAQVANDLEADIIYVDASDINPERFGRDIRSRLNRKAEIISKHHADELYPIVAAASIVAKCNRDLEIEEIAKKYGYFGSGYPSDVRTIRFLREWLLTKGEYPAFSRKSWKTWKRIKERRLTDF